MSIISAMNLRRQQLGMSHADVARLSGVSLPTVVRILSGKQPNASNRNLELIATALGLELAVKQTIPVVDMQEARAREKAKQLVGMVQATSGLESQAVPRQAIETMIRRSAHELMVGSKKKLWSD